MKKFAKMSLVAAVAVAGLTSTASAKDLSQALENVDVSGSVVYRYNDYAPDDRNAGGKDTTSNNYKAVVNIKAPINDDLALNASLIAGADNNGLVSSDTTTDADSNIDVKLSKVNFAYTGISHTTLLLGKQGIVTPFTMASDSDGNEQTGTGLIANVNYKMLTVSGGYFNQTNLEDSNDIGLTADFDATDLYTVGLGANVGPVAIDAWYLGLNDVMDAYTVGAMYANNFSGVKIKLDARYTYNDISDKTMNPTDLDNSMWKVGAKANYSIFGAGVAYGQTNDEGGSVTLDNDSTAGMNGWNTNLNDVRDAYMLKTNVNVQALKQLNVAVNYNEVDSDYNNADDASETYLQLTWTPSKNFYTYVRYGQLTENDIDSNVGRLQVQYSF